MVTLKRYLFLFVLGITLFIPSLSGAGIIDVNSVRVVDVTPVQFAVVWGTSEPATGSVNVFADEPDAIEEKHVFSTKITFACVSRNGEKTSLK